MRDELKVLWKKDWNSLTFIEAIILNADQAGDDAEAESAAAEYASILARLETAERKVEELEEYYATAMLEPCADEQHCTCVPALRKRAEAAEKARDEARRLLEKSEWGAKDHGMHYCWNCNFPYGIHSPKCELAAWLAANPEVKE